MPKANELNRRIQGQADKLIAALAKLTQGEPHEAIAASLLAAACLARAVDTSFDEWKIVTELAWTDAQRASFARKILAVLEALKLVEVDQPDGRE